MRRLIVIGLLSFSSCNTPNEGVSHHLSDSPVGAPRTLFSIKLQDIGSASNQLAIQALQGLLALQGSDEQIFVSDIRDFGYPLWLEDLRTSFGVTVVPVTNPDLLFDRFKSSVDGYLLYDRIGATVPVSFGVASSLSGILHGVPVTEDDEVKFQNLGLTKLLDVRGKDEEWLFQNYRDSFNTNEFAFQSLTITGALRDLVTARRLFTLSARSGSPLFEKVVGSYPAGTKAWGWLNEDGEDVQVDALSRHGSALLAANYAENTAVLSSFTQENLVPPVPREEDVTHAKRLVAFVMSDGDNLQWLLGDFVRRPTPEAPDPSVWYRDPLRGSFPFSWSMTSALADVAPSVMNWYFKNAAANEDFIAISPLGYVFPELLPNLNSHAAAAAALMSKTGMRVAMQISKNTSMTTINPEILCDPFTSSSHVDGMILFHYNNYAAWGGKTLRSHGKICTSVHFTLWKGVNLPGNFSTGAALAAAVRSMPQGLNNTKSYAIVMVHSWSQQLAEVQRAIAEIGDAATVVTVTQLMKEMAARTP